MQFNKKGFTLVELLAVVVILGIIMTISIPAVSRWISKGKQESKESQKKTLLMAGQSYAQGNSKVLPKSIGETKIIKAEDLKKANYLKDNLKDADKNDCMKDSFVRIYKYDQKGYTYTAYIYCEGDEVPTNITGVPTDISISFHGDNKTEDNIEDVTKSAFTAIIKGNKDDGTIGVDGYSYTVSVKYNGSGEFVEIYNSGSLNAGGRPMISIEKKLSEYTDITTASEFLVTVEAYNRDGGYHKEFKSSKYGDTTPPVCGEITGQAGENQWYTAPRTSTISVKCSDEKNGSGCVKNEYTKSWNTEIEDDVITISDNAGNTTDCKVRVHHDWTYPTLTFTAYKRNNDGSRGAQVGTVTADNAHRTVTLNTYTGNVNGWLNYDNFRYGVYYELAVSDNIHIHTGQWYYNNSGIYNPRASNLNAMKTGSSKTFSKTDDKTNFYLSEEGLRRARYEVIDKAGNKIVVNVEANIDRTNPTCTTSKSNLYTTDGVTVSIDCRDGQSGCSSSNTLQYTGVKSSSTYTVHDNASNSNTCDVVVYSVVQKSTRTCNVYNRCANSACGQCTDYSNCVSGSYYCIDSAGDSWNAGNTQCIYSMPCSCYWNCYRYGTTNCTCRTPACGCEVPSPWGNWYNSSCSADYYTRCRTLYY